MTKELLLTIYIQEIIELKIYLKIKNLLKELKNLILKDFYYKDFTF